MKFGVSGSKIDDIGFFTHAENLGYDFAWAPLRGIKASIRWLLEDLPDANDQTMREHSTQLTEQANRLARTILDLRAFSSAQSNSDVSSLVDISALLREIRALFEERVLTLVVEEPVPSIYGPRAALRAIFQNLIENAVKHSGKLPVEVRLSIASSGEDWLIQVADNGKGVDPAYHRAIFEPFRTLSPRSPSSGSGLGLALVSRLAAELGGCVNVS